MNTDPVVPRVDSKVNTLLGFHDYTVLIFVFTFDLKDNGTEKEF